nr:MAG TPA_asm: hypothetical protein [Caudoviricetes sp.]
MRSNYIRGEKPLLMQPPQGDGHKPIKCRVGEEKTKWM